MPNIGQTIFSILTLAQSVFILLIAVVSTAGFFGTEKIKLRLEDLALTNMTANEIIVDKIISTMTIIMILIVSSLPLAGICMALGGISVLEIAATYVLLIVWAFLFAAWGVYGSSNYINTNPSTKKGLFSISTSPGAAIIGGIYFALTQFFLLPFIFEVILILRIHQQSAYSALNPALASLDVLGFIPMFGIKIPVMLIALSINVPIAILLVAAAARNFPYRRQANTVLIRVFISSILLLGLFLLWGSIAAIAGNMYGVITKHDYIKLLFKCLLISMLVLSTIFSTGALRKDVSVLQDLASKPLWSRIFEERPIGGLSFLVACTLIGCLVIILSLILTGQKYGHILISDWYIVLKLMLMSLIIVFGACGIGIMASSFSKYRSSAIVLPIVSICVGCFFYPSAKNIYEQSNRFPGWQDRPNVVFQTAYLSPLFCIEEMCGEWKQGKDSPRLWLDPRQSWIGCSIVWGTLGVVSISIASWRSRYKTGVPDYYEY